MIHSYTTAQLAEIICVAYVLGLLTGELVRRTIVKEERDHG